MTTDSMTGRNGSGLSTTVPPPRSLSPGEGWHDRLPRSRRQRRPGMVAAGVVLIAGFATVAAGLVARSNHSVSVLAIARPVAAGQVLSAADLRVARLSGSGIAAVSASSLSVVVGETAMSSLAPGTLLQQSMLTRAPVPAVGLQVVAVAEKSSLIPAGVVAGRFVSLVEVAAATGRSGAASPGVLVPRARLVGVQTDPTGGTTVLSVEVPSSVAPMVAQSVAAGTIAVTLLPVSP